MQLTIVVRDSSGLYYVGEHDLQPGPSGLLAIDRGHRIRNVRLRLDDDYHLELSFQVIKHTDPILRIGLPIVFEKGDKHNGIPKSDHA